jgi:hypothetical protein
MRKVVLVVERVVAQGGLRLAGRKAVGHPAAVYHPELVIRG